MNNLATTRLFQRQDLPMAAFLLAAMTVAGILRWHEIDESLWLDEVFTYEGASRSIFYAWTHRAYPLYYMLANIALRFDNSEVALRFPSLVAGVLTIPAMYLLASRAGGRAVGAVAVLLLVFNAYHIRYSQEARFYALVMLGSIFMTWSLHRAVTRGTTRDWAGFGIAAFISLLTQLSVLPYFLTLAGVAGLWVAGKGIVGKKRLPWRALFRLALTVLAAFSGLFAAIYSDSSFDIQMFSMESEEMEDVTEEGSSSYAFQLTPLEYARYVADFVPLEPRPFELALALVAALGTGALWRRDRCLFTIVAAQFIIPPLPFFLIHSSHWYASRYFCSVLPLYTLLIALGLVAVAAFLARALRRAPGHPELQVHHNESATPDTTRPHKQSRATIVTMAGLLIALAAAQALTILDYYDRRPNTDWRGMAEYITEHFVRDTAIVLFTQRDAGGHAKPAGVYSLPLHFYLERSMPTRFPENHTAMLGTLRYVEAGSAAELEALVAPANAPAAWVVVRRKRDLPRGCDRVISEYSVGPWRRFGRMMLRSVDRQDLVVQHAG